MVELTQKEIQALKSLLINNIDFNKRRIINAGHSVNLNDYVIQRELREFLAEITSGDLTIDGDYKFKSHTAFILSLTHSLATVDRSVLFPDTANIHVAVLPTSATTQTGTDEIVRKTSPTIVTPTVASLTNMQHNHQNAVGGGSLDAAAIGSGVLAIARGGVDPNAWTGWTPTYSSDIGNAAATFTGTPTTTLARYKQIGKIVHIAVYFTATLLAVTPAVIVGTIIPGCQNDDQWNPCIIKNNGTFETGQIRVTNGFLSFYRANQALYTSAAAIEARATFTFEGT